MPDIPVMTRGAIVRAPLAEFAAFRIETSNRCPPARRWLY
jgi:hypothetical protein